MPGFVKLATEAQVRERGALEVEWDGRIIALLALDGEIRALDGVCPHQGGPLAEGERSGSVVTCPWHGWKFDLRDGRCLTGANVRQPVYPVRLEAGDVLVDLG